MDIGNINIGDRIKNTRLKMNLTLEDLGDKVGVSKSTIQKYENGTINIPTDRLRKISEELNVSPSFLMGFSENETPNPYLDVINLLIKLTKVKRISWNQALDDWNYYKTMGYEYVYEASGQLNCKLATNESGSEIALFYNNSKLTGYEELKELLSIVEIAVNGKDEIFDLLNRLNKMDKNED